MSNKEQNDQQETKEKIEKEEIIENKDENLKRAIQQKMMSLKTKQIALKKKVKRVKRKNFKKK